MHCNAYFLFELVTNDCFKLVLQMTGIQQNTANVHLRIVESQSKLR